MYRTNNPTLTSYLQVNNAKAETKQVEVLTETTLCN